MAKISHVHGGNLFKVAREAGVALEQLVDFSANINPLGPSRQLLEALTEGLNWINHYPDSLCWEAKEALAKHVQLSPEYITLGNGAIELIYLLMHNFKPQKVLLTQPTFSEYESAVAISGGKAVYHELSPQDNFSLDLDYWLKSFATCDWAIVCNPNNPTGVLLDRTVLQEMIAYAEKHGKYLLVDEAFIDFTQGGRDNSVVELLTNHPNLLISYSLTKILAIPGLRLGALLASPAITKNLHQIKDPWNVNSLAQLACSRGLEDKDYFTATRSWLAEEQRYMLEQLKRIPTLKVFQPNANFMLLQVKDCNTGVNLRKFLLSKAIMVRDCSSFPTLDTSFVRIAIKNRSDNEKIISSLSEFFERQ